MNGLGRGLRSSVATKFMMALTGLMLFGFVVAHMLGNLQVFAGRNALNTYAEKLQSLGPILLLMRGGLLVIFVVHVVTAVRLTRLNQAARPVPYASKEPLKSSFASRSMLLSGMVVLAFVVYHLLHFTYGVIQPDGHAMTETVFHGDEEVQRTDVYGMVVTGFSNVGVALSYLVAMVLLGLHLSHGLSSLVQSLGFLRPKYREIIQLAGSGITALIVVGNCAMPLACLLGIVTVSGGGH